MSEIQILKFQHWLPDRDSDANWITVAQDLDFEKDNLVYDYFTISIIAETNDPKLLVSDYSWLGDVQFGQQSVWEYDDEVHFDYNSIEEKNGVKFEPFVMWRSCGSKSIEPKFELIQDFILFYNLYFNEREQVYNAMKETGEEIIVVKIINKDNYKKIEVRTNFLRNYLAFKNKILVRQHDHRIRTSKSLSDLGISRFEIDYTQNEYNFSLIIDEYTPDEVTDIKKLADDCLEDKYDFKGRAHLEEICVFRINLFHSDLGKRTKTNIMIL